MVQKWVEQQLANRGQGAYFGPLESHVTSSIDAKGFVRADISAFVASNIGACDIHHGAIVWNLTNGPNWGGCLVPVSPKKVFSDSPISNNLSEVALTGRRKEDNQSQCYRRQ